MTAISNDQNTLRAGDRLPAVTLDSVDAGTVTLRRGQREATVVFIPHPYECDECSAYLTELDAARRAFGKWDGRVLAIVDPEPATGLSAARDFADASGIPILLDRDGALRDRTGADDAALLIADRYGAVYDVTHAGTGHKLPDVDEVEEWLRFLALQCPECGVPDEPGLGEWAP